MEQHHHHSNEHLQHSNAVNRSVEVSATFQNGVLSLHIMDEEGLGPKLELTHEKLMHLIIVSNDLNEFYHLHPKQVSEHEFKIDVSLSNSSYTAFVDILPIGNNYQIRPIRLSDSVEQNKFASLRKDIDFKKEVDGKIVELVVSPLKVDEEIILSFHMNNAIPEQYLGALGHVVIIDQKVEQFLHVHPVSENETVFKTQFGRPGTYKLWAEFKFNDEVIVFPYVIEVM
ncbi:hypothetical protein [Robertmurraya massiliosenegalensis]|uniref:hypothetical protein n=1 Tax=Robertmurraya massiliosenegalensis TaxID=1287657 RepID=UPI0002D5A893|nr:hypothetical protein [Robertmurraya massiliosenegalensis]